MASTTSSPSATDLKLAKRKLDALKRGIHRFTQGKPLPFSVNVVGVGKAGADVVAELLRTLPPNGPKFNALVVDIGDSDLQAVQDAAAQVATDRAEVDIVCLAIPSGAELAATMRSYGTFLQLESPWHQGRTEEKGWLSATPAVTGTPTTRAFSKALYGRAYYDGERAMKAALRRFGARVDAAEAQSVVCMVFGIGGATGSGIIVDMARHLSNVVFGRGALTVGLGVLPCAGDKPTHRDGALFACLNELDCLGDEAKNEGVVRACGELFRNPFTAGFLIVPQQHVWEATKSLAATHKRTDQEIVHLLTARGGANLMETLRMLNWVAAPSTQHSAARTPFGSRWMHMLGFADVKGALSVGPATARQFGLYESYEPEYVEVRTAAAGAEADGVADSLEAAFSPAVSPQLVEGGRKKSIQFILPCVEKFDLDIFFAVRDVYDSESKDKRISNHSMLLEQGVVLSEPSTRLHGMAGAGLHGGEGWVAVPFNDLRGAAHPPARKAKLALV